MRKKRIFIFGSTGSIGSQTLDIVSRHKDRFKVVGLNSRRSLATLTSQIVSFKPELAYLTDPLRNKALIASLKEKKLKLRTGLGSSAAFQEPEPILAMAKELEILKKTLRNMKIDLAVNAVSGYAGIIPTLATLDAGVKLALANKESVVIASALFKEALKRSRVEVIPIDSEPNAIFQCLQGERREEIKNLWITASGGPFRNFTRTEIKEVTAKDALRHPRWKMGPKITVDSATLMNKGLEVIETSVLFDLPVKKIKVIIHPQSIIHSMVEFIDGTFKAVLSETDMRYAIQHALLYPERGFLPAKLLDLTKWSQLTFEEPDSRKFPCLQLALDALGRGGSFTGALCVSNEVAVNAFLKDRIRFTDIPRVVDSVLASHRSIPLNTLEKVANLVDEVTQISQNVINRIAK